MIELKEIIYAENVPNISFKLLAFLTALQYISAVVPSHEEAYYCNRWDFSRENYKSERTCLEGCQGYGFVHPEDGVICYEKRERGEVIDYKDGLCTCGMKSIDGQKKSSCKKRPGNIVAKALRKQCPKKCAAMTIFTTRTKKSRKQLEWCHPTAITTPILVGYVEYTLTGAMVPDVGCTCKLLGSVISPSNPHPKSLEDSILVGQSEYKIHSSSQSPTSSQGPTPSTGPGEEPSAGSGYTEPGTCPSSVPFSSPDPFSGRRSGEYIGRSSSQHPSLGPAPSEGPEPSVGPGLESGINSGPGPSSGPISCPDPVSGLSSRRRNRSRRQRPSPSQGPTPCTGPGSVSSTGQSLESGTDPGPGQSLGPISSTDPISGPLSRRRHRKYNSRRSSLHPNPASCTQSAGPGMETTTGLRLESAGTDPGPNPSSGPILCPDPVSGSSRRRRSREYASRSSGQTLSTGTGQESSPGPRLRSGTDPGPGLSSGLISGPSISRRKKVVRRVRVASPSDGKK